MKNLTVKDRVPNSPSVLRQPNTVTLEQNWPSHLAKPSRRNHGISRLTGNVCMQLHAHTSFGIMQHGQMNMVRGRYDVGGFRGEPGSLQGRDALR